MKNNAKTKISLVSILVILGVAARMMRVIHRQQIREQNRQTIQTTKKVAEFQKTLDEEETKKRNETFNKIYNESLVRNKFENWQKVDELHGLGQRTGQFYIYNFEKKEEIKDGQWHIMNPDGSSQLQLGEASISAESKFVIENNVLDYDQ